MALRDLFRRRRRPQPEPLRPLSEEEVRRLQRVQRATGKRVRIVGRRS